MFRSWTSQWSKCRSQTVDGDTVNDGEMESLMNDRSQSRWHDRMMNLLTILTLNILLILILYAFPIKTADIRQPAAPSQFAYQVRSDLSATEMRSIIAPNPQQDIEDMLWSTAVSNQVGFVWIEDPSQYKLPAGLPGGPSGERKLYGLSWGHQMHCLMMIRDEYQRLLQSISEFVLGPGNLNATERARFNHITHCFHYLREIISCNRDLTLEWAAEMPDELGNPYHINGYGIPHRCRVEQTVDEFTGAYQPEFDIHVEMQGDRTP